MVTLPTPSRRPADLFRDVDAARTAEGARRALFARIAPFCADPTWRVTLRGGPTGYDVTLTNRPTGACYHAHIAQTDHTKGTGRRVA
jgi:hypothetical protein